MRKYEPSDKRLAEPLKQINICPELAGFSREFLQAMRSEVRPLSATNDRHESYSDLTHTYCSI